MFISAIIENYVSYLNYCVEPIQNELINLRHFQSKSGTVLVANVFGKELVNTNGSQVGLAKTRQMLGAVDGRISE